MATIERKQTILDQTLKKNLRRLTTKEIKSSSPAKKEQDTELSGVQIARLEQNMARRLSSMMSTHDPRRLTSCLSPIGSSEAPPQVWTATSKTPQHKSLPPVRDQFDAMRSVQHATGMMGRRSSQLSQLEEDEQANMQQLRPKRKKFLSAIEQSEQDAIRRKSKFYNVANEDGKADPVKLVQLIERSQKVMKMPYGLHEGDLFDKNEEDFNIDDIYINHGGKIDQQLRDIVPGLRSQGEAFFNKSTIPGLTVLLHDMHMKQARDLAWLEQKTAIFENPVDKRMEELRQICLKKGINNPIIGDLYDHKKPDTTIQRPTFKDYIRKKAGNPDVFRNYKRDRREVMGENKRKGEEFQKKLAEEQEMTILKAIYQIEGAENLDKAQRRKLRLAGIIKKRRAQCGDSSEEAIEAFKKEHHHNQRVEDDLAQHSLSRNGSTNRSQARALSVQASQMSDFGKGRAMGSQRSASIGAEQRGVVKFQEDLANSQMRQSITIDSDSVTGSRESPFRMAKNQQKDALGQISIIDGGASTAHDTRRTLDIKTPKFATRNNSQNRGATHQQAVRKKKIQDSALTSALRADSIFTSIMSDTSQGTIARKQKTGKPLQQNQLDDIIRKRVSSQLNTAPNIQLQRPNQSTRASSNPRHRNHTTTDFIELNKRMQSLQRNMGKEAQMGNSSFLKHIEAVAAQTNAQAFPLTSVKDESQHLPHQPQQQQLTTTTRPNTQVVHSTSRSIAGGSETHSRNVLAATSKSAKERILDQKRIQQKLNETTRCDFDNINKMFFPSPKKTRLNCVTPIRGAMAQMQDEERQENISNPGSIFKKMREKAHRDGVVRDKSIRHREQFKGRTSTMKDADVNKLCKKYTVKPSEDMDDALLASKGLNAQMELLRSEIKRKQNHLVKMCETENKKTSQDKFNIQVQQLLNNFKQDEFIRNQRLMETVSVAEPASLKQLYCYVLNTELAYILEGNEVAKDYHEGKFDPCMLKYADPKKLKKKPQKKRIPI